MCPRAGGVGLRETVQHLSMFDFVAVSGSTHHRWIGYADHLHEHLVDPVRIRNDRGFARRTTQPIPRFFFVTTTELACVQNACEGFSTDRSPAGQRNTTGGR